MPEPDASATIISARGHQRTNSAWVIGRVLRDFEYQADLEVNGGLNRRQASAPVRSNIPPKATTGAASTRVQPIEPGCERTAWEALRITVFEVDPKQTSGCPTWDWVFHLGIVVILVQIGIAAIPWVLWANYLPFVVTLGGTALSLLNSALPQWRNEKYARYIIGGWTVSITRGNGSRHVMLILGKDHGRHGGLDLEILAGKSARVFPPLSTRICMTILAALSVVLLITVAGLKDDKWCT